MKVLLLILSLCLYSCLKDTNSVTGTVKISFINTGNTNYSNIQPQIFIPENLEIPLIDVITLNSTGETENIELNYGNYCLRCKIQNPTSIYYLKNRIFQVKPDKETNLIIDFNKE